MSSCGAPRRTIIVKVMKLGMAKTVKARKRTDSINNMAFYVKTCFVAHVIFDLEPSFSCIYIVFASCPQLKTNQLSQNPITITQNIQQ
jgi:hypothetical protein